MKMRLSKLPEVRFMFVPLVTRVTSEWLKYLSVPDPSAASLHAAASEWRLALPLGCCWRFCTLLGSDGHIASVYRCVTPYRMLLFYGEDIGKSDFISKMWKHPTYMNRSHDTFFCKQFFSC